MNKNRLSTKEAAKLLGLPEQTLRVFIQYEKFPEFSLAVKIEGSKHYTYYINANRLYEYLRLKEPVQMAI